MTCSTEPIFKNQITVQVAHCPIANLIIKIECNNLLLHAMKKGSDEF